MNFEAGTDTSHKFCGANSAFIIRCKGCGLRLCIAMNYQQALNTSQRCLLKRLCYACMQIFFAPGGKRFWALALAAVSKSLADSLFLCFSLYPAVIIKCSLKAVVLVADPPQNLQYFHVLFTGKTTNKMH
ncbi:hypothetical protein T01_4032 [Trichinella spiralis]|uniref:Uncharacterized protein n=1 Tax=Trichinella spiralis TaxID=6334 RepID=A0A0V1B398_TRISP|nr:hypothetical protein T01_4032 [Trichinella spiralis]